MVRAGRAGAASWAGAAVLLLAAAAPPPGAAVGTLRDAGSAVDPLAPVLALVSLLAWGLAGWLVLTVFTTAGGHLPGQLGRVLAALARRTAPVAVRRTIEVGLGLSVVLGALTAPAAADAGRPAAPTPGPVSLDWGGVTAGSDLQPATVPAGSTPVPDLDWAPPATATPTTPPTPTPPPPSSPPAGTVVVRPGDTLWDLAAADLQTRTGVAPANAQVAEAWPRWWAANRDAVGADPHLLHPGTALSPPTSLAPPTSG